MSSSRIEHVFYNAHSKVSRYVLRRTSHRLRSAIEHAALGLAVCGFCVVILSHRTFVHREDVASIARGVIGRDRACAAAGGVDGDGDGAEGYGLLGNIVGEGRGVSVYAVVVSMARTLYARMVPGKGASPWSEGKKIPGRCLKSIPGFRQDADVNHILLRYENDDEDGERINDDGQAKSFGSRAFTVHRGGQEHETIVSGMSTANSAQQSYSCIAGTSPDTNRQRTNMFGFAKAQTIHEECSPEISSFLDERGYLPTQLNETLASKQNHKHIAEENQRQYSSVIYSYSYSQGFLRLQPSLQHAHNISTQFIIASSTDPNCFGEPFTQSIIFRLVGPDTVVLNWILGLQHDDERPRPRFVYHSKTKKELDLDVFDMDHYAFASKSKGVDCGPGGGMRHERTMRSAPALLSPLESPHRIITRVQKYPMYHFLRFLTFKFLVLLSTLLIFFLTTSLVSFTFQETQDRMLEFTLRLQTRVRARMPLGGLILGHVLENLVFVPIMVGMVFFLIEFYEDKFLAFTVLSMVWVCEVFSAISIRSAQGMHFFPRVFFLYFTLFHVYFFSCPIGFTYASLASTILFLFHTMLFFLNRYELPALHAGLITPQSPRMARLGEERGRETSEVNNRIVSPPRIQPAMAVPQSHQNHPPEIPLLSSLGDRGNYTLPTAPLSSTVDFTPQSDQATVLYPMRSYIAAASTSLQSIRSLASIQSSSSFPPERTTSPNFIFQGGYNFNDPEGSGDGDEDSYIARVMSS